MTRASASETRQSGGFDPVAAVFVAQSRRPPGIAAIDATTLTPMQRSLLVIDGTVTTFLEAWSLEPVEVRRLEQQESLLPTADEWLDVAAGATVLRRRVMLRGRDTRSFFAWADSLIAVERLGPDVRLALEHAEGGIGKILIDAAAETRRECLWYGREPSGGAPPAVAACWPGDFLTRTYRVMAAGRALMVITERFPL